MNSFLLQKNVYSLRVCSAGCSIKHYQLFLSFNSLWDIERLLYKPELGYSGKIRSQKKSFLHCVKGVRLNINSLLPKIDELRNIAKLSNAAVIGIGESKLDDSVLSSEIHIDNYNTLHCDRNRHGEG